MSKTLRTNNSNNRIVILLMILGLSTLLLSGCNQSQIDDLKKRVSSANSSPNSNSTTANNNTTANANVNSNEPANNKTAANTNVNSNGNSSNNVDSATNTNNQASNPAAKKEFNIEAFFGSYLGFDNVTSSTSVPSNVGKYNLTKPAVVSRVDGETVKIANFGGFDSFINVKIKPSSTEGVSDIEFTDPGGRKFKGTANFSDNKITGKYRVTYDDNTFDDANFEYTKQN
jgi:hypothetical protein